MYELALKKSDEHKVYQEEQKRLAKEKEEKEHQSEIERIIQEKRIRKNKEEQKQYWENNNKGQIQRRNYNDIVIKEAVIHKETTIEEVLIQNPKIESLMEYISKLDTIAGPFTYISKENRSSISKYEVIKIKEVKLNPHRMRLEIHSYSGQRYIVYLKFDRKTINTRFTWDGYMIFSFDERIEKDVILKFRQVLECNGERCVERYICGLEHECPHKENDNICTFKDISNKCAFRSCIKEFICL